MPVSDSSPLQTTAMKIGNPVFRILKPGFLTTIQDLGRLGQLRYGVPSCGAMDSYAFRIANNLVGNSADYACLETTFAGLRIEILKDCILAVTGADLSPTLDGEAISLWKSFFAGRGTVLSFSKRKLGCRAYLGVAGGIAGTQVMASSSTDLKNEWGGIEGRALRAGDILLDCHENVISGTVRFKKALPGIFKTYEDPRKIHVVLGPQKQCFPRREIDQFFANAYLVTPDSDRMGYRLQGNSLHGMRSEIISDSIPVGALQVLPNGQLILLMVDRPTIGGYPKIAVVCSADLPKCAQLCIGDSVRFEALTVEQAVRLLREQERRILENIVEVD